MNVTAFPGTLPAASRAASPPSAAAPAAEPPPPTDWPGWIERTVSRCPKPGQALIAAWADLMGSLVSGLDPAVQAGRRSSSADVPVPRTGHSPAPPPRSCA